MNKEKLHVAVARAISTLAVILIFTAFLEVLPINAEKPVLEPPSELAVYKIENTELGRNTLRISYTVDEVFAEYAEMEDSPYYALIKVRKRLSGREEWFYSQGDSAVNGDAQSYRDEYNSCYMYDIGWLNDFEYQYFKEAAYESKVNYSGIPDEYLSDEFDFYRHEKQINFDDYTMEYQFANALRDLSGNEYSSDWSESVFYGKDAEATEINSEFENVPKIISAKQNQELEPIVDIFNNIDGYYFECEYEELSPKDKIYLKYFSGYGSIVFDFRISYNGVDWTEPAPNECMACRHTEEKAANAEIPSMLILSERYAAKKFMLSTRISCASYENNHVLFVTEWSEPSEFIECGFLGFQNRPHAGEVSVYNNEIVINETQMPETLEYISRFIDAGDENTFFETSVRFPDDNEWTELKSISMNDSAYLPLKGAFDGTDWDSQKQDFYMRVRYVMQDYSGEVFRSEWSEPFEYSYSKLKDYSDFSDADDEVGKDALHDDSSDKCNFCHICNKPFGLCIFGWIVMIGVVAAVIVLSSKKNGSNKKD